VRQAIREGQRTGPVKWLGAAQRRRHVDAFLGLVRRKAEWIGAATGDAAAASGVGQRRESVESVGASAGLTILTPAREAGSPDVASLVYKR